MPMLEEIAVVKMKYTNVLIPICRKEFRLPRLIIPVINEAKTKGTTMYFSMVINAVPIVE